MNLTFGKNHSNPFKKENFRIMGHYKPNLSPVLKVKVLGYAAPQCGCEKTFESFYDPKTNVIAFYRWAEIQIEIDEVVSKGSGQERGIETRIAVDAIQKTREKTG
ncbi:MAG TPA: hypothetical protein P5560_10665 [Thermotogota bacterium]|nr:hypothetical protein [Thermotogota bacterium]